MRHSTVVAVTRGGLLWLTVSLVSPSAMARRAVRGRSFTSGASRIVGSPDAACQRRAKGAGEQNCRSAATADRRVHRHVAQYPVITRGVVAALLPADA